MTGDHRCKPYVGGIITQGFEGHTNMEETKDSAVSLSRPDDRYIKINKTSPLPLIKRKIKDIFGCMNNGCAKMNARFTSTTHSGGCGLNTRNAFKWEKTPLPHTASAFEIECEKFWKYKLNQIPSEDLPIDISAIPEVPAITYKQPCKPEIPPRPAMPNKTPTETKIPEIPPCIIGLETPLSPENSTDKPEKSTEKETIASSVSDPEIKPKNAEVKDDKLQISSSEITGFRFRQTSTPKYKTQQKSIPAQINGYRNSPLGLTTCSRERIYTNLYNEPLSELPRIDLFGTQRSLISKDTKKPVILETLGTSYGDFCCVKRR